MNEDLEDLLSNPSRLRRRRARLHRLEEYKSSPRVSASLCERLADCLETLRTIRDLPDKVRWADTPVDPAYRGGMTDGLNSAALLAAGAIDKHQAKRKQGKPEEAPAPPPVEPDTR